MDVPAAVLDLLGPAPQRLRGHGAAVVLAGNGLIAKIGPGAPREAFVLGLSLPVATPSLVAQADRWVVTEEVTDAGDPWSESDLFVLLDDLAALHDAFVDRADILSNSPLDVPLPVYLDHLSGYGDLEGLPPSVRHVIEEPGPILDVLTTASRTLVHGDPYRRNVRRPSHGGRVWIDWEDAVWSAAELDLAAWLFDGPWHLGRRIDRDRAVKRYLEGRSHVDPEGFEQRLDAAILLMTVSQDLASLRRTKGRAALEAFVNERLEAIARLERSL
jgi:hypothetical protein